MSQWYRYRNDDEEFVWAINYFVDYFVAAGPNRIPQFTAENKSGIFCLSWAYCSRIPKLLRKSDQVYFAAAGASRVPQFTAENRPGIFCRSWPTVVAFYSLLRKADQVYFAAAGPNRVP